MEKRWTVEEVATDFGVCVRTVQRWIEVRDLVAVRIGSLTWILDSDLQEFVRRHRTVKLEPRPRIMSSIISQDKIDRFLAGPRAARSAASRK